MSSIQFPLFVSALLVIGMGGIIAQTILLRELLIVFSGNEFSLGIIIGSWVVWEALGAYLSGKTKLEPLNQQTIFVVLILIFSVLFPLSIYGTRTLKVCLKIPTEVGLGIIPALYSSLILLLTTSFVHGALFTCACTVYSQITRMGVVSIGKVYFYEMVGTIIGGVLTNFLLIPHFHSFHISIGYAIVSIIAALFLMPSIQTLKRRYLFIVTCLIAVISVMVLTGGGSEKIHSHSITQQWRGRNVLLYENSLYQNIVVIKDHNQYTFFADGTPIITTPVPDITSVEEFVHIPLLSHPYPESVLVLSGGAGGIINEILKYPGIKQIDYVETDASLLKVVRQFSTPLTDIELYHPKVTLYYEDGRFFVKKAQSTYDVVLLNTHPPLTLQGNRFFTQEFFGLVKKVLKDQGIFVLRITGSSSYYTEELKALNKTILTTLSSLFPVVFVIPGDTNIFMASVDKALMDISPDLLIQRLNARTITTNLISLPHLNYRFDLTRKDWFFANINQIDSSLNRDFFPKALFHNITYHNLLFDPSLKPIFNIMKNISFFHCLILLAILFLCVLILRVNIKKISVPYAIGTTGFVAMGFELILLLSFQIFYGYVFYVVGILITSFMAGIATGSIFVISLRSSMNRPFYILLCTECAITAFSFLLVALFLKPNFFDTVGSLYIHIIFFTLLFFAGMLTGIEFPLANTLYVQSNKGVGIVTQDTIGKTVGLLYGLDLLGGWLGGIMFGLLILPVLGLLQGCLILAAIKISSVVLLLTFPGK